MRTILACLCLALAGCGSSVQAISDGAQAVQAEATEIRKSSTSLMEAAAAAHSDFQDIHIALTNPAGFDPAVLDRKAVEGMALVERITLLTKGIDASAAKVHEGAKAVLDNVPGVVDVVPWWASLLKTYGTLAVIVLIVAGGFYLGVWPIVARFIAVTFGWTALLPKTTVARAKMDSEALAMPTADPIQRESVALTRADDPDYDAAIKALKKKGDAK